MSFTILPWDTDFFNFNVARIDSGDTNDETLAALYSDNIRLAYFSSAHKVECRANEFYEIKLVDEKLTFAKKTSNVILSDKIISYAKEYPEEGLIQLAIRSGKYSRYNIDEKIGSEKFEELYRQWIIKSVSRELADEVLVYMENNIIAGFVTLGQKNNRADIGIIAVEEAFGRRGIGKALINAAEHYAAKKLSAIQVVTQGSNIAACKLYESCGFKAEEPAYFYHLWKKD